MNDNNTIFCVQYLKQQKQKYHHYQTLYVGNRWHRLSATGKPRAVGHTTGEVYIKEKNVTNVTPASDTPPPVTNKKTFFETQKCTS